MPLSVLDLVPVGTGVTPGEAIRNSFDLARRTEALGFTRYWLAEHHGMPGIASSATALLIGQIAAATSTIRVGSGGVMLPNHSSLVVAEQFGTLGALFPGRIDLGLGRAPGTDQATARALRRIAGRFLTEDEFPEQLAELTTFLAGGEFPEGHRLRGVTAVPRAEMPPIWLLGSSGYSAQVAGALGLPFAFAHHFSSQNTLPALELYRSSFRPSAGRERPYAMVAAAVLCAETDEHADWLAGPIRLTMARLRTGRPAAYPSPEEVATHPWTEQERAVARAATASHVIGSPETVRSGLRDLLDATGADELMVTTNVHAHADRVRSYELLTGLAKDLVPPAAPAPTWA
ncbi:LLM class flavin-dependent oxidoreductase [Frankia sp. CNm7]|uniref:LLM class flavin-dependent oxidoreductase n=1 Tax=Frankia nepalensis TaxID=1836974 RepID=A0A937RVU1_9ACTN|nr:LLM class flavin-dependent oxidoreductase [Frankia nepalensis]MBL7513060.1 LLM class flavin-dependent oxidoreductase [Frankia nepalensis]MBL7522896.1 LLM class flavin-dependent oxidoreductase [Frankia nepalensis]MBL7633773.1 LLM class flavin-dependent oxidoreductase [Frankia nepalensis]